MTQVNAFGTFIEIGIQKTQTNMQNAEDEAAFTHETTTIAQGLTANCLD